MLVTLVITLYTSRVILQKLGVDDFGIYQAVGGVVGFLSFLNSAISTGSSRFITFELGNGDFDKLKRTFSTLLTAHFIIAFIIVLFAETIGLWFVNNKMVISEDRLSAAVITYQISIFTAVLNLTQVPYNASIIAHEKMSIFAYISIFDAVARLGVCYLIGFGDSDNLISYALLMLTEQLCILLFYRFYCSRKFKETKFHFLLDKKILKPVLSFSGWSLFGASSYALSSQGVLVLLNMFFAPAVVSARAISLQVNSAAVQLVNNFQIAANPQIVKLFAKKDYEGSRKLLFQMTKFSFYLMMVISVPVFFLSDQILHLWLGTNVPEYTTIFLQIVIVQSLFEVFDSSFYLALFTKGSLKENAITSPILSFLIFPIIYFLFKGGYSPVVLSWAYLINFALLGLLVKPLLIVKIADYKWKEIIGVFIPCFYVSSISAALSFIVDRYIDPSNIGGFLLEVVILVLIVCAVVYVIGIEKSTRNQLNSIVIKTGKRYIKR
jgi:Na+-driven multidrug efflux pump